MFVTTLAPALTTGAPQVKEPQAATSHKPRARRKVVATRSGGIVRITRALLGACCLLSAVFAVQPSFDASKVVRHVRGVARPASGIEQGLDDGEFLLDTSVSILPAYYTQQRPDVAFDGTNYLVVWTDYRVDNGCGIYGARVNQSGTVLDPAGIPISTAAGYQVTPAVSFGGTSFLVVWTNDSSGPHDIYGARVSQFGTVLDSVGIPVSTAEGEQGYPALSFDGTNYLVSWEDTRNGLDNADIYGARVSQSGIVLDPSGISISTAVSPQRYPSVSFDGTNYLAVWTDGRSIDNDIYGSRVSQSGTVLDTSGIPISTAASPQRSPALSFDGVNFLVAWRDERSGPYDADIYGARVTESGTVLEPDGIPISTAANFQGSPAVSFDGTNYLVVWTNTGDYNVFDIYGARVSQSGTVLEPDGIPISTAAGDQEYPALSSDGTNYLVVWTDWRRPSSHCEVYGARVSQFGSVLEPDGVVITTAANWQWSPAVSFDGTNFLAVWEDYHNGPDAADIYGTRVSQSGAVLDPQGFAISTVPIRKETPAVSSGGTNYLVVWTADYGGGSFSDIYAARVSRSGTVLDSVGIPICTAAIFQDHPEVSFDGTNYFVVWEDARVSAWDIYGARVSPAGVVLDSGGIPISTAERSQVRPRVSFDGTDFLVVWADTRNSFEYDIYGARVSQSGTVLDTAGIPICTAANPQMLPAVSFDGTNFLVVWADNRSGSSYDIYGARIGSAGVVLDSNGIRISTATSYESPAVSFDGTSYLAVWERELNGSQCIYGARVTPEGAVFDSGPVVRKEAAGGSWAVARGTGSLLFLVYQNQAWTVGGKAYNSQRIWGKMNPATGIEQEEKTELRRAMNGATVVRGMLFLPTVSGERPQVASLHDISGRKVLDLKPGPNDVRALAPGVYFVRDAGAQGPAVRKVVLTR
jgi:hypothetical protein